MGETAAHDNPGDGRVVAGTCCGEARPGGRVAPPPLNPPSAIAAHCLRPQTSSAKGPLTLATCHNSTKLPPVLPGLPQPTETHRYQRRRQRRRRRRRQDLPKQLAGRRNDESKNARSKAVQVSVRPGIEFQSVVLRDLCCDVVTPEPSSNSGAFWITPPFHSPRFSAVSISNMLSFFLCAPPLRVRASAVENESSVFCARVASENVASFILNRRELKLHKCIFTLHASLPAAAAMAGQLREEEDFTLGHLPLPGGTEPSNTCAVLGARGRVDLKRLDVGRSPNLATVPSSSTRSYDAAPPPPVLSPAREQRDGEQSQGKEQPRSASPRHPFNAAANGSKKTYAEALLSSGVSTASGSDDRGNGKRRAAPFVPPSVGCFRCLSSSHMVRDCRDPLRCRRCGGNGHRQSQCAMPVARCRQTSFTRRHPASARHVRHPFPVNAGVPCVPRTLPPPPLPEQGDAADGSGSPPPVALPPAMPLVLG